MESRQTSTVTCDLAVELVVPGEAPVSLRVDLEYDSSDPYAVRAVFHTGQGSGVSWVFARELLATGMYAPTGEGDVRVWPSPKEAEHSVLVALRSPDGEALLRMPASTLVAFLGRTYSLVPEGHESRWLDVDAAVGRLLTR